MSSNFNKPVLAEQHEPQSPKVMHCNGRNLDCRLQVEDIFALSAVSFGSPLTDVSPARRRDLQARLSEDTSMTSIESQASSLHNARVIAPYEESDDDDDEDQYEDIEEIKRSIGLSSVYSAPEPPPRNSILKPESVYDDQEKKATDNIYSDLDTSGDSNKNLMDAEMVKGNYVISEDSSEGENEYEEASDSKRPLGARPKTNSAATIDIRSKVSKWYEEAEQEVERDLALDISALDSAGPPVRRKEQREAYEHVSMAFAGRPMLADGEVVPRPTMTLLRDFDPCHLGEYGELVREGPKEVTNALYGSMEERLAVSEGAGSPEPPATKPRKLLPSAVKKINFGPPKPPRNFNYSSLEREEEEESVMSNKPIKQEVNGKGSKSNPKKSAKNKVRQQLDDLSILRSVIRKDQKERKDSLKGGDGEDRLEAPEENLYVTLPVRRLSDQSTSSPEESPRPPTEPPPPLPVTAPPGSGLPRTSVYENVWVEPETAPALLPPVPARPARSSSVRARRDSATDKAAQEAATSKTHLLDARFQGRKASQESLVSQGSLLKARSHTKSESIDSGSSASSYSITSESPTQPSPGSGPLGSSHSSEHLDTTLSSPGKARLKKFPNNRSFTVANLGPKLNKLPEMATNIRRRMSNQFTQAGPQVTNSLSLLRPCSMK